MDWKDGLTATIIVGLGYLGLQKVVKGPIYHAEGADWGCVVCNYQSDNEDICDKCKLSCRICGDELIDGEDPNYDEEICQSLDCMVKADVISPWLEMMQEPHQYLEMLPPAFLEKHGYDNPCGFHKGGNCGEESCELCSFEGW